MTQSCRGWGWDLIDRYTIHARLQYQHYSTAVFRIPTAKTHGGVNDELHSIARSLGEWDPPISVECNQYAHAPGHNQSKLKKNDLVKLNNAIYTRFFTVDAQTYREISHVGFGSVQFNVIRYVSVRESPYALQLVPAGVSPMSLLKPFQCWSG